MGQSEMGDRLAGIHPQQHRPDELGGERPTADDTLRVDLGRHEGLGVWLCRPGRQLNRCRQLDAVAEQKSRPAGKLKCDCSGLPVPIRGLGGGSDCSTRADGGARQMTGAGVVGVRAPA